MLEAGIISNSNSEWLLPIQLVPKINGGDKYPLPRIEDYVEKLSGSKYFSILDFMSRCWHCLVDPQSKKYTEFLSPYGTFEFNVLTFGLSNAPSHFSRMMDCILTPESCNFVAVYLDDFVVFSKTKEEYIIHLNLILERLEEFNISVNLKKCQFFKEKFTYLGYEVTAEGISPDQKKVECLNLSKIPRNVKEVRSTLGLTSYFRKFIEDYAELMEPIQRLVKKNSKFIWTKECDY
ncbi:Retrovirus-related Pol polyprotein from transposon [Smittium culicis]|uniref:Retrovirus-related Pol polyprotein from transposon n=1 Tax=Smittium culicis TaxID=133412 RepID=A0A1R1YTB4_9FUNG|nr:Retrovirus-related Pol polyprotein from transposon [Smittium culicis]